MAVIQITSKPLFNYQDLHLNLDSRRRFAVLDSRPLVLTRKEYELLSVLVENAGITVTRRILLERVWGYGNEIRTQTLKVHIHNLRKVLGSYGRQCIENIFGIGYRFQPVTQKPFHWPRGRLSLLVGRSKIVREEQSAGLMRGVTLTGRKGDHARRTANRITVASASGSPNLGPGQFESRQDRCSGTCRGAADV